MSIERLAAEDVVMLWPDAVWPQDIGALAFLDGRSLFDSDGMFRIDDVKAAVASRLHLLPRLRQLLYVPRPSQGGPLWVDAPAFDIDEHIHTVPVTARSETALLEVAERLVGQRLDRSRPLWQMWFLTGLPENRVGWLLKLHHCIADGIAGVATFGALLDANADAATTPPEPWTPAPAPPEAELIADHRLRRAEERRRRVSSVAHPLIAARRVGAAWPGLHELLAEPGLPPTSLTRTVGAGRRLAIVRSRLDTVKAIAHASGAKVNDVLLAAIAAGLRSLLRERGEGGVEVVRVYVPISLRPMDERANARGNRIAEMMVPLPVGESDSLQRLSLTASQTARRKSRSRPSVGGMPTGGVAGKVFLRLLERQRVNVETADLPGPPIPLYFAGARLVEVFPILPLIGTVALGVGAMSYAGQFNVMVVADRDAYPDLEVFAAGMREELAALEAAALPMRAAAG